MSDKLDEAVALVKTRLKELGEEQKRLEKGLDALTGDKRGPGRPPGSTNNKPTDKPSTGKPRRKRRGGTRRDQALRIIAEKPGIAASDIAKEMKIKPNYLYRVLGELEKEKLVIKKGRFYSPAN